MSNYNFKSINVSHDTYAHLRRLRSSSESMNEVVRRLAGLPLPDPTREPKKGGYKRTYYKEDK